MQRAAAATMPTTMPVVLLLSRTTSDGPGNSFPSDTGGRAAQRGEAPRYPSSPGGHAARDAHFSHVHVTITWTQMTGDKRGAAARLRLASPCLPHI